MRDYPPRRPWVVMTIRSYPVGLAALTMAFEEGIVDPEQQVDMDAAFGNLLLD